MKLPKARSANLVVQDLKSESLIYDQKTHKAFCLNQTLAKVFNACDGKRTFADLRRHGFTDDLIYFSLNELKAHNLLEDYQNKHFGDLSRREVIKRVGLASMIALPVIAGLSAPLAAHAQSVNYCAVTGCANGGFICSQLIIENGMPRPNGNCATLTSGARPVCCAGSSFCGCVASAAECTNAGGTVCA